ncbi:hypothetical protein C8J56DRAFT_848333 [Mycena floridula]|nr:hypothetical protein C8J56DRAFT_848333 [Mycena floridula]
MQQTQLHNNQISTVTGDFLSHNQSTINHSHYGLEQNNLKALSRHDAAYNSFERQREEASVCAPATREAVLGTLDKWALGGGNPVCWLYGPAGAGKSTIAHTVAERSDMLGSLAVSYFFSRRYADRSNLAKFVPTIAFELSRRLPSLESAVNKALKKDPRLFQQRLENQLASLVEIINPILSAKAPSHPLVVVIDGLDEYNPEEGKIPLEHLVHALIDALAGKLQFRILLTSRPEAEITELLELIGPMYSVALQDFPAIDDVENYLIPQFGRIAQRRKLGADWPGRDTVHSLAEQSEGIFAYASTLVRFVDDKYGDPRRNLEIAKRMHKGLDSLYVQVLEDAQKYPNFQLVLAAVVMLRDHPAISAFPSLLGLDSLEDIRVALRGCLSVLILPNEPSQAIRLYHTSLQDFLTDPQRHQGRFFNYNMVHLQIFSCCTSLIMMPVEQPPGVYASRHWAYHLCSLLADQQEGIPISVNTLLHFLKQDLNQWMYSLRGKPYVITLYQDLQKIQQIKVSLP